MKRLALVLCLVLAGIGAGSRAPTVARAATTIIACPLSAKVGQGNCPSGATLGLQNAITAATPGSTIQAVSGCYFENLDIEPGTTKGAASPGITILGAGPGTHTPAASPSAPAPTDPCFTGLTTTQGTYIDGGCAVTGLPTVYIFEAVVTLEGVTIQNGCVGPGFGSDPFYYTDAGAGLYNDAGSSTLLQNSWVFFNATDGGDQFNLPNAGGVYNYFGASITLINDTVENNESIFDCGTVVSPCTAAVNDNVGPPLGYGDGGIRNDSFGYSTSIPDSVAALRKAARPASRPAAAQRLSSGSTPPWHFPTGHASHATAAHATGGSMPAHPSPLASMAGSQANGLGMLTDKGTVVTVNLSYNLAGGIGGYGTSELKYPKVTNNYGGDIGGIAVDDEDYNGTLMTVYSGLIQGNHAGYFYDGLTAGVTDCDVFGPGCNFGGFEVEDGLVLNNTTQVTGNTYNTAIGDGFVAGGIGINPDGESSETWETVTINSGSIVSGNTPPQCARFDGHPLPSGCPGT